MTETKSILLTILAPTSIFLIAQAVTADPAAPKDLFGLAQTFETCSILLYAVWSLTFTSIGWFFFVDRQTRGLKRADTKYAFAAYIAFLASIIISALLLNNLLKIGFCL